MLPGTFTTPLKLALAQTISVVATGATIAPLSTSDVALTVDGGATLDIRGIRLLQLRLISCGSTGGQPSKLSISDGELFALNNNAPAVEITRCALSLAAVDVNMNSNEDFVAINGDATFDGNRLHVHGNTTVYMFAFGTDSSMEITNSLLEDVGLAINTTDSSGPGSEFTFAEDTFIKTADFSLQQGCEQASSAFRRVRYENSVIAPLGAFDAVTGTSCTFNNTFLSHQTIPPAGTLVGDPEFVDPTMRDYHLKATSAAIDAAVPSLYGLDASVDLDGTSRPQGAMPDLGAYERVP